uniref:Uncharacterized protein n=1 Tax=Helianthus annuus TaxID=4232 RepID=A0A251U894_HELAN
MKTLKVLEFLISDPTKLRFVGITISTTDLEGCSSCQWVSFHTYNCDSREMW